MVSGAGGKLDRRAPTRFAGAGTQTWAAEPHCQPAPIARRRPDGTVTDDPIVIRRDA